MNLPDIEQLCANLIEELRPVITPRTAMVGVYTGGLWLAELDDLTIVGHGPVALGLDVGGLGVNERVETGAFAEGVGTGDQVDERVGEL